MLCCIFVYIHRFCGGSAYNMHDAMKSTAYERHSLLLQAYPPSNPLKYTLFPPEIHQKYNMPESDYTKRLADWLEEKAKTRRRRSTSKVAVLAVKKEIMAALDAGYDLINIHEHMREIGMISISYEAFRRHVQQLKKHEAAAKSAPLPSSAGAAPAEAPTKPARSTSKQKTDKSKPGPGIAGFHFNPKPNPEELL